LFGGFADSSMFKRLLNSFSPGEKNNEEAWDRYRDLHVHDAIQINLRPQELKLYLYIVITKILVKKKEKREKKKKTMIIINFHFLKSNMFKNF
jgi:hypothetical protein